VNYVSAFSGIEAASVAWHPLGWRAVALIEFDTFPSEVLAHHYPNVPNLGDITKVTEDQIKALGRVDVFVFGSPCQDLSVAGKRKGLEGERSGLFFDAMRLVRWLRQHCGLRWAVWENVPGAFSSNEGRDFAAVVEHLAGADVTVPPKGWGVEGALAGQEALVEWSTLDAQWFGVAQRRRRVFAVADFGDWAGRPPILLEPDSVRGDSAPSRTTGQRVAGCLSARTQGGGGLGTDFEVGGGLVPIAFGGNNTSGPIDVATARNACASASGRMDFESETFLILPSDDVRYAYYSHDYAGDRITDVSGVNPALTASPSASGNLNVLAPALAFDCKASGLSGFGVGDVAGTMRAMGHADSHQNGGGHLAVAYNTAPLTNWEVRRLTPRECERLQGFPDDYTQIPRGKKTADQCPDGPRYKALGNSMAVPVMRWIGRSIDFAHNQF
jgi:DNA (cytosine-5)-methyltransferase 1